MTSLSAVFTEKERTNWLKAWLAVDIAKSGLEQFVNNEAKTLHANIYRAVWSSTQASAACIGCHTANVLKCPTQGVCNKRGAHGTCKTMHDNAAKQPRPCPASVCNKVHDEIVKQHTFNNPSWKNTSAQKWAKHPWEIAKAYLPPDGYVEKTSVQETDFNGIISFMMNCNHFHNKFSFTIAKGKHNPPCLLTKAREIGKTVRHSSQCKLTDSDLQDIFTTLTSLLSDQTYLAHDVTSQEAVRKLAELEQDTLKITTEEMFHVLEAAQDTLKTIENIADKSLDEMQMHLEQCRKYLNTHLDKCKLELNEHTAICTNAIDQHVSKTVESTYQQSCKGLIERTKKLYRDTLNRVALSPLNDYRHEKLRDVYMPPKIVQMSEDKGVFKKTEKQVKQYKDVFLTDDKVNPRIFLQGEAGSGKTTFLAKLALDWCGESHVTSASDNRSRFFSDFDVLEGFSFVFHINSRYSVKQFDVYTMIKEQIIDSIYSQEDREKAYRLVNEIMKREKCLILLDGLDEWTGPGDHHNLPTLVVDHNKCAMLFSTRPWKLAVSKITQSDIYTSVQLEGINKPFELSKIILSSLVDKAELENKYSAFKRYIRNQNLSKLLSSPMMLSVIVCSFADGIERKGSKCEIYILLLESLFKKANSEVCTFEEHPFTCFTGTEYIKPNMENLNRLAEMAFHLLFVHAKDNSLVFNITELKKFKIDEREQQFALNSGILSAERNASALRSASSLMFFHLSMQEFLAAYHIACNTHLIDDIIYVYLNGHQEAYLDISQVFIFLCGLDMSGAEKLSLMMYERDALDTSEYSVSHKMFNKIILAGYREAYANGDTDISLKLSYFYFDKDNIIDLHRIWKKNAANVIFLEVEIDDMNTFENRHISSANDEPASHITFDLNLCRQLERLSLRGRGILLKDSVSLATSDLPVWIVLNISDPNQCIDLPPVLLSIKEIDLNRVTCSSTWLRSLLSMMLTRYSSLFCMLKDCHFTECVDGAISTLYTTGKILLYAYTNNLSISLDDDTGLWKTLQGLNIKCLSLDGWAKSGFRVNHEQSFSQTLSSLSTLDTLNIEVDEFSPGLLEALHGLNTCIKSLSLRGGKLGVLGEESLTQLLLLLSRLETLAIGVWEDSPGLWKSLYGLNIKSLSLLGRNGGGFRVKHPESLSQSLLSLKQMETLSISSHKDSTGLWGALYGLNIKYLNLDMNEQRGGLRADSLSQALSSLTRLKQLCLQVDEESPGMWEAFKGLNIKSLSVYGKCKVKYTESLSQSLSSLAQLETLRIDVESDGPGLWDAFRGLNIKSLTLDGCVKGFKVNHKESLFQSLLSLTQMETLSIRLFEDCHGLLEALHGLNIKSLRVFGKCGVKYTESLSQSLSSLAQLETLIIDVESDSPGLWDALHGLNIKNLTVDGGADGFKLNHKGSLLSLKQLETLSLWLFEDCHGLLEALHGLNIRSLNLVVTTGRFKVNHKESLSQSLSSLTQLNTLSVHLDEENPGLWEAFRGLNIISLSLYGMCKLKHAESLSQSISSLTLLDTLRIFVDEDSSGILKAIHGLNIKNLSVCGGWPDDLRGLTVEHAKSLCQSLSSLIQLETLTLYVNTCNSIGIPQSLKFLNIYCDTLIPSKLRALVDTLASCTHRIECKLEFGCASSVDPPERIPLHEYFPIEQELGVLNNVAVKRFRIYEWSNSAGFAKSLRAIGGDYDAAYDDLSIKDDAYESFAEYMHEHSINRISIRLQISPDSSS